jgi:type IV secretory pathway VirB2 component (pilin)
MNKILSDLLGYLNGAIAVLIIIGATFAGTMFGGEPSFFGAIVGWIVGIFIAILTCGLLAILISIRDELKAINKNLKGSDTEEK